MKTNPIGQTLYEMDTLNAVQSTEVRNWDDSSRISFQPDSLNRIVGDFNGDGKLDSAIVLQPFIHKASGYCSDCRTCIVFSNNIDTLLIPHEAIDALLFNVGDLDSNGTDELIVIPDWFNSCLGTQNLYTYESEKWKLITKGNVYRCYPHLQIQNREDGSYAMKTHDANNEDTLHIFRIK
ncbi:MAG: hypothetical protein EP332_05655 [Bacteroidetes bacterium]|nr:MAG: hypothetical protein EP332_05655 [Bacteroidota bacterium]